MSSAPGLRGKNKLQKKQAEVEVNQLFGYLFASENAPSLFSVLARAHFSIQTHTKAVLAGPGHSQAVSAVSAASVLQRKPLNFFGLVFFSL